VVATEEITGHESVDALYGEGAHLDVKAGAWRWNEYYNALECVAWMQQYGLEDGGVDLVVIEDFILRPAPGRGGASAGRAGISPARIGGYIGLMLELGEYGENGLSVVWQTAAMAKPMNKARMEALGLWVVGSEHKRDAVRHCYVAWGRVSTGGATVKPAVGGSTSKRVASKAAPRKASRTAKGK